MRLVYDATGRKWFKYGEFGTTSYTSASSTSMGNWKAIYAPDGRMVAEYAGGQITRYRAEYFHQDHLGNTRLVFLRLQPGRHRGGRRRPGDAAE